jgi:hypothetical protein
MQRYVILYCAPMEVAERFAQATPEQAMEGMKLWGIWFQKLGTALVDPGGPLGNAMKVTKDEVEKSDSNVIGMTIVQANSMNEALDMVKDHHHLSWAEDCELVVLEEMPIPELQ